MGIFGLYAMALGAWLSPPLSMAGQLMMLVGLIRLHPSWVRLANDRLVQMTTVFTAYVLLRTLVAGVGDTAHWVDHAEQGLDLIRLGFGALLLPAFWMARDRTRLARVALLAVCGFVFGVLTHEDIRRGAELLYDRPGFGMPVNAFGLYCAIALLGLVVCAARILKNGNRPLSFAARGAVWGAAVVGMVAGLVVSQSRSAWLGLSVGFPLAALLAWRLHRVGIRRKAVQRPQVILWGLVLLIVLVIVVLGRDQIGRRMTAEIQTIQAFLTRTENDSYDSVSSRLYIWQLAVDSLRAKPFFGWGPAGPQILLDQQTSIQVRGSDLRDFHNSYLEILVQLGLTGGLLWAGFLWLLLSALAAARREGWLPADVFLLVMGGGLVFMIATAFNLRTGDHSGREFVALFGAMAYAYRLRWLCRNASPRVPTAAIAVPPDRGARFSQRSV